jgi:hypothetical protein
VTAATLQGARRPRSLLGKVIEAVSQRPKARKRVAAISHALHDHVATVAAFAAFDYGMFETWHPAAWITAAPLLIILEWKVRGD